MINKKLFSVFVVIIIMCSSIVYAGGSDLDKDEIISRQKSRVEKASPDDWKTFAECADVLVSKRIKTEEALIWITKSIEINETIYNRVIKGDYLVTVNRIREAQEEYVRAIQLARELNKNSEIPSIQWKILISMGINNYNKFHGITE